MKHALCAMSKNRRPVAPRTALSRMRSPNGDYSTMLRRNGDFPPDETALHAPCFLRRQVSRTACVYGRVCLGALPLGVGSALTFSSAMVQRLSRSACRTFPYTGYWSSAVAHFGRIHCATGTLWHATTARARSRSCSSFCTKHRENQALSLSERL
jgi:hypothetical protein